MESVYYIHTVAAQAVCNIVHEPRTRAVHKARTTQTRVRRSRCADGRRSEDVLFFADPASYSETSWDTHGFSGLSACTPCARRMIVRTYKTVTASTYVLLELMPTSARIPPPAHHSNPPPPPNSKLNPHARAPDKHPPRVNIEIGGWGADRIFFLNLHFHV